ncbi:DMT family protein, partial [Xanthomonas hortorum]
MLPARSHPDRRHAHRAFTAYVYPILLLLASNVFMIFAWYGHLKYKSTPLMIAILVSWGIAFFEYCLQVPGNRLGSAV